MRVALVEYLNTLPFVEAIKKHTSWEIIRAVPSKCIKLFEDGTADLALVPVGGLANFPEEYKKITNYGICSGEKSVNSVFIFSNYNIEEIETLYLDADSRTSNILAQLIIRKLYNKDIKVLTTENNPLQIQGKNGFVRIGDKAMKEKKFFNFHYDLAELWTKWQNLPFVFAIWIIKPEFYSRKLEQFLNNIFAEEMLNVENYLHTWSEKHKIRFSKEEIRRYFSENIRLFLSKEHNQALNIFINLAEKEFSYAFAIV